MPELPEVEILARHLDPLLRGSRIRHVEILRPRILRPSDVASFQHLLNHRVVAKVRRRAKYLLFDLEPDPAGRPSLLLGHLGMTGRMYLQPRDRPLARHAAAVFDLDPQLWIFEDPRGFGHLTFDDRPLASLGPEPLSDTFTRPAWHPALRHSRQPIKIRLLNPSVVAGIGNIYASECLHLARLSPRRPAHRLTAAEVDRLVAAIRQVLSEAIQLGTALTLNFGPAPQRDALFYYGSDPNTPATVAERFRVYDRAGQPCPRCGTPIRRSVQAGRSTFDCPRCQR
ncbi:MAG: bifunctional DNA-formamidopyrimidine glycosylase/DNA-(apurinic or apyrimidinic site) lyase [Verrucomicrobiae bacterium]|nr:bifunctional DNA-formamidopyrimidine glycosylase/DNA-(apurinic or apyrimidinic site) lyase [Verrucomicrobiae bacterium]